MENLESWTRNSNDGVKYFSGTATYTKTIQAPSEWFHPATSILIDLGTVKDLAEVSLNGKNVATLWKPPYRVDVSNFVTTGDNRLEIKITNQWTNRLTGDRVGPPEKRVLATVAPRFPGPPSPPQAGRSTNEQGRAAGAFGGAQSLGEAGLIGPVTVWAVNEH